MARPLAISIMGPMSCCTCFDFGDVVYDKPIGTKQYKVCLVAPNKKLGLDSLSDTRWVRKLTFSCKKGILHNIFLIKGKEIMIFFITL